MTKLQSPHIKKILDSVRENFRILDRCAGPHDFQVIGEIRIGAKYKCTKCNGVVDGVNKRWYESGLKDGRTLDNNL